jgi:hypothetical protein
MDFSLITDLDLGARKWALDTGVYSQVRSLMADEIHRHFRNEVNPGYRSWPDLQPETWARKTTSKMLVETGEYLDSVKLETLYEADNAIITQVYTDMPGEKNKIPTYHEYGWGDDPSRTRRSFVWLSKSKVDQIADLVGEAIVRKL